MNEAVLHKHYFQNLYNYFRRFVNMSGEEFEQLTPYFEIRKFDKKAKLVKLEGADHSFKAGKQDIMSLLVKATSEWTQKLLKK